MRSGAGTLFSGEPLSRESGACAPRSDYALFTARDE
jgi:hypothetical protein